jgi:phosphohistidine swiveling domain-containing protein
MTTCSFSVNVSTIVNLHRQLLVEERDFLEVQESLIKSFTPDLDEEFANSLLSGSHTLSQNDDNERFLIVDNNEETVQYLKNLDFIYRYYFIHKKNIYKAYAVVDNLGYIDAYSSKNHRTLTKKFIRVDEITEQILDDVKDMIDRTIYRKSEESQQITNNCKRALHYANDKKDSAIAVLIDGKEVYLLCEKIERSVPQFEISIDPISIYKAFVESPWNLDTNIRGFHFYNWYMEQKKKNRESLDADYLCDDGKIVCYEEHMNEIKFKDVYANYKKQILINSKLKEHGWIELRDRDKNLLVKVPKLPFLHWACERTYSLHLLPHYDIVCPSGMKMQMDSRPHSDWMIGANLNLDDDYSLNNPIQKAALNMRRKIQKEYLNFDITVLSGGKNASVTGNVIHCTKNNSEDVNDGDIVIIPDGSEHYEEHVRRAVKSGCGGVIAVIGSRVCHMAIISRELGIVLMYDPDAMTKYTERTSLTLEPQRGNITVNDAGTYSSLKTR